MDALISQYSVIGLIVIVVIRDFLKHMKEKDEKLNSSSHGQTKYDKLQKEVTELHEWHSMTDPLTGVRVWYLTPVMHEVKMLRREVEEIHSLLTDMNNNKNCGSSRGKN